MTVSRYLRGISFLAAALGGLACATIQGPAQGQVCFGHSCFDVELAITPSVQAQGLMFRSELADKAGMLFVYEGQARRAFWMKNTLIPLDIIWIDKDKKVVFIKENVQPCPEDSCPQIEPPYPAMYVLELNAGRAQAMGLECGDKLTFDLE